MTEDFAALAQLNVAIGQAETNGDLGFLEALVADKLAFRRASGAVVDRAGYLAAVAPSEQRTTEVESVHMCGDIAVVTCIVTVHRADGERPRFHNLRLFTLTDSGWKILGWANTAI